MWPVFFLIAGCLNDQLSRIEVVIFFPTYQQPPTLDGPCCCTSHRTSASRTAVLHHEDQTLNGEQVSSKECFTFFSMTFQDL